MIHISRQPCRPLTVLPATQRTKVTRANPARRRKAVNAWRPGQEPRFRHLRLVAPWRDTDMGIRLVMEAAGHAPASLTWREKYALSVFAASAIDATRECPAGIEDRPEIIKRLGLGRSERYAVLASLCAKGALVRLERGRNGVKAVYAVASFTVVPGSERPGDPDVPPVDNPDAPAVDNGVKGPGNPDATGDLKGPGSTDEGSGKPGLKGPGIPDSPPYRGIKGFKTGGGTPLPPGGTRPLFPFALPDVTPEEGDIPMAKNPAPNGPGRQALAGEIRKTRPEWSTRSIIRALAQPAVTERPWPLVREAMRILAADQATQHPGRLEHDGPWWEQAARRTIAGTARDAATHPYDHDPETGCCRTCRRDRVDKCHRQRRTA